MEQKTDQKRWIYIDGGEKYDVLKLPEQAQQALKLMVEVDQELQGFNRQRAIYSAATAQLNEVVRSNLSEEALIEEEEALEEASKLGGRAD